MKALLLLLISVTSLLAAFDHTHAKFTDVLKANVKGENVDYAALHKDPDKLGSYLVDLAAVDQSEYAEWSDDQKMAYLINLYNAATLKLIVDEYPVKSIRDINSPWKQNRVKLFGKYVSLDHIEHEMLRKDFSDPRIHFGVNCASIGCPALRAEAFTAAKLDAQLNQQARNFLRDSSKNRVDQKSGTLYLSSIFDWFKGDFVGKSGSVEKFIAPYLPDSDRKAVESGKFKVKYTDYNWSLNKL
ncbi:MAG: DUF547 domain-containing protein [Luteolibacter sp.]